MFIFVHVRSQEIFTEWMNLTNSSLMEATRLRAADRIAEVSFFFKMNTEKTKVV